MKCINISLPPKMNDSATLNPKVNSLMNLFLKREPAQPLPNKKPAKKVKPNEEQHIKTFSKLNDPLYQILSWRDDIKLPTTASTSSSRTYSASSITEADPENWGTNVQGIFINVDWNITSMQSFKRLTLNNNLLSNGMVFVWGTKTNIGELLDHFEQMGYVYAENFIFVMLDRQKTPEKTQKKLAGNTSLLNFFTRNPNEQSIANSLPSKANTPSKADYEVGRVSNPTQIFLNSESQFFSGSQRILYMFRKINKKQALQLRHQRTSDVFFTIGDGDTLDSRSKEVVYRMIETLLISANYKEGHPLKLMELWANVEDSRKGWIMVSQNAGQKKEVTSSQECCGG